MTHLYNAKYHVHVIDSAKRLRQYANRRLGAATHRRKKQKARNGGRGIKLCNAVVSRSGVALEREMHFLGAGSEAQ